MSWYASGNSNSINDFAKENPNPKFVNRFFMKKGEKKNIIFLTNDPFAVWEATIPLSGKFQQYTSSRRPDCPLMLAAQEGKVRLSLVQYYSILDLTPYTSKDGKEHKYSKKLLGVKGEVAQNILQRRRDAQGGNILGCMFTVHRDGEKSAACGSDYEFVKKADLSSLPADVLKPHDFMTILAPAPNSVLESILSRMGNSSKPGVLARDQFMNDDPFGGGSQTPDGMVAAESEEDIPF